MDNVRGSFENGILTVFLSGHIDSVNSGDVENEIMSLRSGHEDDALIIDAEELKYISSAGLRIILRLLKSKADMKIINVSPEVYEVFDMTGFSEMMTIEKAYRKLSVDGCEVIGEGSNGVVYRYDRDTVVKVYRNPDSLDEIRRERELSRTAFILDIPTAIPYDVVRVGNSYGSVFELLNASSFASVLKNEPERFDELAETSVKLLKTIHSTTVKPGLMPEMKPTAVEWAEFDKDLLPEGIGDKLVALVKAVPEDSHMLHGDYHIKNIELQDGEVLLIDMDTLCVGNPVFEFGSVYNAYQGFGIVDHSEVENFLGISWDMATRFWDRTVRLYLGTDDEDAISSFTDKARIIGYARILRRTVRRRSGTPEGDAIIKACRDSLTELISRTDSLII